MKSTGSHYLRDVLWLGRDELKASHYEISPRERDDEERRAERDFGVQELAEVEKDDKIRRQGDGGPFDEE